MKWPIVEPDSREGGAERCFYCRETVGRSHAKDCVTVKKRIRVRMTVVYEVSVPHFWDAEMVEFHRNESSWCADNALDELDGLAGCLCDYSAFEYLGTVSDEPFFPAEHSGG